MNLALAAVFSCLVLVASGCKKEPCGQGMEVDPVR